MTNKAPKDLVHLFSNCKTINQAFMVYKENSPSKSNSAMLESMALHFERTSPRAYQIKVYRRIGDIYVQMSETGEAVRWYNKAKKLEEEI